MSDAGGRRSFLAKVRLTLGRAGIRKDPVKFRVVIPEADPPDIITHDLSEAPFGVPCALLRILP